MKPAMSRWTAWIIISSALVLLSAKKSLYAEPTREEYIAHFAKVYKHSSTPPEIIYEKMLIQRSFETFAERFSVADVISLTGAMEEDSIRTVADKTPSGITTRSVKFRSEPPGKRAFITTADQDYPIESRKDIRSGLYQLFHRLSPDDRIVFRSKQTVVQGAMATVDATFSLRTAGKGPHDTSPSYPIRMQFRKVGENWLVTDIAGIVSAVSSAFADR